jgi:two-component system capsular synthesis response regulator RcsB
MPASSPSRVLILDDHAVVRLGYEHALGTDLAFSVAGSFATSRALLDALWAGLQADVLLLDYSLGANEIDGINLIAMLRAKRPSLKIIVASAHDSPAIVSLVLRAGASGFIGKADALEELLPALRRVLGGLTYLSVLQAQKQADMAVGAGQPHRPEDGMSAVLQGLSPRELDVLRCLLAGMTITGIANKFSRSIKTVSNQKQSAFKKLGVSTMAELMAVRDKVEGL